MCTARRSRKMLSNEWLLIEKIGADTAEKEPFKVSRKEGVQMAVSRGYISPLHVETARFAAHPTLKSLRIFSRPRFVAAFLRWRHRSGKCLSGRRCRLSSSAPIFERALLAAPLPSSLAIFMLDFDENLADFRDEFSEGGSIYGEAHLFSIAKI